MYDVSDTSFKIPRLVYDVTARTASAPVYDVTARTASAAVSNSSCTFITVFPEQTDNKMDDIQFLSSPPFIDSETPTNSSTPSPRTLAEIHNLPIVAKISLESLTTPDTTTSGRSDLGRLADCDMETVAYF